MSCDCCCPTTLFSPKTCPRKESSLSFSRRTSVVDGILNRREMKGKAAAQPREQMKPIHHQIRVWGKVRTQRSRSSSSVVGTERSIILFSLMMAMMQLTFDVLSVLSGYYQLSFLNEIKLLSSCFCLIIKNSMEKFSSIL